MTNFKGLLPLYTVLTVGFLGYALTITVFIPMLMDHNFALLPLTSTTPVRAATSGILLAMYPLGQFLGSPIIGNLSDHFGRKKILSLSLIGCVIGFVIMALSICFQHINLLFVSTFFTGLCESNMAIAQSIIVDKFQDAAIRAKYIGYAYSASSLGYIIGPLLGGSFGGIFGYSGAFWITALLVLCLIIWISCSFNDPHITNRNTTINILQAIISIKSIINNPKLYKIYLINFLIFFAVMGLYRVVPLFIEDNWHPKLSLYSTIIAYVSLLCCLANLFILGQLLKYFTNHTLLTSVLIIGGLLVILIPIPHNFYWIWVTYGAAVLPTVMALPTCTTWLSHHALANEQGQVLGNNQALLVLGEASSAALGGLIAAINVTLPVFVMGIILLIVGIAVLSAYE